MSARADYAIRALLELAAAGEGPVRAEAIARAQAIPSKFLENVLADLRRAPGAISLADVIRAVDGPLAGVRDLAPEDVAYPGAAAGLRDVWIALRASMRAVLETTTLADVATGRLPAPVRRLIRDPDAWQRR